MKIAYEKHPVSAERKAELRAQGFKIIDARFKPEGAKEEPKADVPTRDDIATMKKGEVREWLEAHGADTSGAVGEMRERLVAVMFVGD